MPCPPRPPTPPPPHSSHCLNAGGTGAVKAANGGAWSPYDPLDAGALAARAGDHGVCGDPVGDSPGAHTAGGKFYHGGKTVATYAPGGTIDFELDLSTNHNGYAEWWICDLDACGEADLTTKCFGVPGACHRLDRVPHPSCEAGTDETCGAIHKEYPSRWYLPCRGVGPVVGGTNGKMRYQLPAGFTCTRCVVQWYWVTANSCTPPGMGDYTPPASWGGCSKNGQLGPCGAGWPEEFWTCADVAVGGAGGGGAPPPPVVAPPAPTTAPATPAPLPVMTPPPTAAPVATAPPVATAAPPATAAPVATAPPAATAAPTGLPYCIMPSPPPCAPVTATPAPIRDGDAPVGGGGTGGGGKCAAAGGTCAAPKAGMKAIPCCDDTHYCKFVNGWASYCAHKKWDP